MVAILVDATGASPPLTQPDTASDSSNSPPIDHAADRISTASRMSSQRDESRRRRQGLFLIGYSLWSTARQMFQMTRCLVLSNGCVVKGVSPSASYLDMVDGTAIGSERSIFAEEPTSKPRLDVNKRETICTFQTSLSLERFLFNLFPAAVFHDQGSLYFKPWNGISLPLGVTISRISIADVGDIPPSPSDRE